MKDEETIQVAIEKIDELNQKAWESRVSDSNIAFSISSEASDLAAKANYCKGKAEALRTLGFTHIRFSQFPEALKCLEESLDLFKQLDDNYGQADIFEYFGIIHRSKGDYGASLESLLKSLELRKKDSEGEALSWYHLGVTYKYLGNLEEALDCFLKSLSIAREKDYWIAESYSLNNIGGIYFELGDYKHALDYYEQSLIIRKRSGDKWGEAGCLDNIGRIHFILGNQTTAIEYCEQALKITEQVGDKKGHANTLFHLAEIYGSINNQQKSRSFAFESLSLREEAGDKKGQAEIYLFVADRCQLNDTSEVQLEHLQKALKLGEETKALDILQKIHYAFYRSYKQSNQFSEALVHLELFYAIEKETHSNSVNQKMLNLEITHKVEQSRKEAEIFRLKNIELAGLFEEIKKQKEETELEKAKSDALLRNILPDEIADELKRFGRSYARKHQQVSILFADIEGFSLISEKLSAEDLVSQLDECFRSFDHIVGKHGLEKIKTIGDAYVCAGGLPVADPANAVSITRAACDMIDFIKGFGTTKKVQGLPVFNFRIGIHTGPVVTGVVGFKKFTYDVWGDTVNLAARMEQHGEAGKINISASTYELIKNEFHCIHRGKIAAKNKGEVDMYFVEGLRNS